MEAIGESGGPSPPLPLPFSYTATGGGARSFQIRTSSISIREAGKEWAQPMNGIAADLYQGTKPYLSDLQAVVRNAMKARTPIGQDVPAASVCQLWSVNGAKTAAGANCFDAWISTNVQRKLDLEAALRSPSATPQAAWAAAHAGSLAALREHATPDGLRAFGELPGGHRNAAAEAFLQHFLPTFQALAPGQRALVIMLQTGVGSKPTMDPSHRNTTAQFCQMLAASVEEHHDVKAFITDVDMSYNHRPKKMEYAADMRMAVRRHQDALLTCLHGGGHNFGLIVSGGAAAQDYLDQGASFSLDRLFRDTPGGRARLFPACSPSLYDALPPSLRTSYPSAAMCPHLKFLAHPEETGQPSLAQVAVYTCSLATALATVTLPPEGMPAASYQAYCTTTVVKALMKFRAAGLGAVPGLPPTGTPAQVADILLTAARAYQPRGGPNLVVPPAAPPAAAPPELQAPPPGPGPAQPPVQQGAASLHQASGQPLGHQHAASLQQASGQPLGHQHARPHQASGQHLGHQHAASLQQASGQQRAASQPQASGHQHAASLHQASGQHQHAASLPQASGQHQRAASLPQASGQHRRAASQPQASGQHQRAANVRQASGQQHGARLSALAAPPPPSTAPVPDPFLGLAGLQGPHSHGSFPHPPSGSAQAGAPAGHAAAASALLPLSALDQPALSPPPVLPLSALNQAAPRGPQAARPPAAPRPPRPPAPAGPSLSTASSSADADDLDAMLAQVDAMVSCLKEKASFVRRLQAAGAPRARAAASVAADSLPRAAPPGRPVHSLVSEMAGMLAQVQRVAALITRAQNKAERRAGQPRAASHPGQPALPRPRPSSSLATSAAVQPRAAAAGGEARTPPGERSAIPEQFADSRPQPSNSLATSAAVQPRAAAPGSEARTPPGERFVIPRANPPRAASHPEQPAVPHPQPSSSLATSAAVQPRAAAAGGEARTPPGERFVIPRAADATPPGAPERPQPGQSFVSAASSLRADAHEAPVTKSRSRAANKRALVPGEDHLYSNGSTYFATMRIVGRDGNRLVTAGMHTSIEAARIDRDMLMLATGRTPLGPLTAVQRRMAEEARERGTVDQLCSELQRRAKAGRGRVGYHGVSKETTQAGKWFAKLKREGIMGSYAQVRLATGDSQEAVSRAHDVGALLVTRLHEQHGEEVRPYKLNHPEEKYFDDDNNLVAPWVADLLCVAAVAAVMDKYRGSQLAAKQTVKRPQKRRRPAAQPKRKQRQQQQPQERQREQPQEQQHRQEERQAEHQEERQREQPQARKRRRLVSAGGEDVTAKRAKP